MRNCSLAEVPELMSFILIVQTCNYFFVVQADYPLQRNHFPEEKPVHAEAAQLLVIEASVEEWCAAGSAFAL